MIHRHRVPFRTFSSAFASAALLAWLGAGGGAVAQETEATAAGDSNLVEAALPAAETAGFAAGIADGNDSPNALTEYVHVPGSAFVPMHSASGVEYSPWGCMYMTGPESASNFAVVVPDGSTVTYLRLYFYDVSATHDGIMQFAQYNDGVNGTYLDTLQTSGSGGDGTVTHTGLSIPIDYVNYSYVLYWDVPAAAGSQLQLCGFRVGFER